MRTETYPFVANTEIGPATPSESSGEISQAPASWSKELTPWEKGEYLADQTPTKPQPKSALGKLASKSKSFFRKLAKISKSLVSEMVDNPKLQLRWSVRFYLFPKLQTLWLDGLPQRNSLNAPATGVVIRRGAGKPLTGCRVVLLIWGMGIPDCWVF
jgi:hypothetical protein